MYHVCDCPRRPQSAQDNHCFLLEGQPNTEISQISTPPCLPPPETPGGSPPRARNRRPNLRTPCAPSQPSRLKVGRNSGIQEELRGLYPNLAPRINPASIKQNAIIGSPAEKPEFSRISAPLWPPPTETSRNRLPDLPDRGPEGHTHPRARVCAKTFRLEVWQESWKDCAICPDLAPRSYGL